MFGNNHSIVSLDIGTSTIKLLVVSKESEGSEFNVLSQVTIPSSGVRKGVVVKPTKVAEEIRSAIEEAQVSSGQKINSVYSSINGSHLTAVFSKGVIAVSRADREISQEDIDRAIQNAQTISLPANKEIIDAFPREFIIDGEGGIKEPLGMKGTRLETEVLLLYAFSPYLQNLTKAILGAGLQITDIRACPVAASEAVLTPQQKEKGIAVADIGAGLTKVAVFKNGSLVWASISSLGSENITDDLGVSFQVDPVRAEEMKVMVKSSLDASQNKKKKIPAEERGVLKIIKPRVEDILEEINRQILSACSRQDLPAGVVFTGGGAKLKGIEALAKKEFKLPVSLGYCSRIAGLEKDLSLATVAGLALMARAEEPKLGGGLLTPFKRLLRILKP